MAKRGNYSGTNYLGITGARLLAERIEAYWAARGWSVQCRIEPMFPDSPQLGCYAVRSDMVNGRPRSWPKWEPFNPRMLITLQQFATMDGRIKS